MGIVSNSVLQSSNMYWSSNLPRVIGSCTIGAGPCYVSYWSQIHWRVRLQRIKTPVLRGPSTNQNLLCTTSCILALVHSCFVIKVMIMQVVKCSQAFQMDVAIYFSFHALIFVLLSYKLIQMTIIIFGLRIGNTLEFSCQEHQKQQVS